MEPGFDVEGRGPDGRRGHPPRLSGSRGRPGLERDAAFKLGTWLNTSATARPKAEMQGVAVAAEGIDQPSRPSRLPIGHSGPRNETARMLARCAQSSANSGEFDGAHADVDDGRGEESTAPEDR